MYGQVLSRDEAEQALARVRAELPSVIRELAAQVEASDMELAEMIRAGSSECLDRVLVWGLPRLRTEAGIEASGRIEFSPRGIQILNGIGNLYVHILLTNHSGLELRIGDDPEDPARYAFQNHIVVGLRGAGEEIDPFVVVVNLARRALRQGCRSVSFLGAYRSWIREVGYPPL